MQQAQQMLMQVNWWWVAGGYLLAMLLLYLFQERFIFKPEKLSQDFRFKYDIPFQELFFDTAPGVRINGLHFQRENPAGLVLYFHGNTRSIKGWGKYARDFYRYNYDVLLVDYRGFGKSTGRRDEQAMLGDMQYVYDRLRERHPENHLIVYGRSMGSGFATKLASDNHPRYLILDAPYYNFSRVVERLVPVMPLRLMLRFKLRSDRWIRHVRCPIYIIHGTHDRLIPIGHSVKLQALNPQRTTLIRIRGGGHNNLPDFPEYHNFIRDILQY
jgi:pimeloyl-ACP methyl ester carboxylesterase